MGFLDRGPLARLDDIDGEGLFAVLAAHGVDYDRWCARSAKRKVAWTASAMEQGGPLPWKGEAEAALARHRAAHRLAPEARPPIVLRTRVVPGPPKKPWWKFW